MITKKYVIMSNTNLFLIAGTQPEFGYFHDAEIFTDRADAEFAMIAVSNYLPYNSELFPLSVAKVMVELKEEKK